MGEEKQTSPGAILGGLAVAVVILAAVLAWRTGADDTISMALAALAFIGATVWLALRYTRGGQRQQEGGYRQMNEAFAAAAHALSLALRPAVSYEHPLTGTVLGPAGIRGRLGGFPVWVEVEYADSDSPNITSVSIAAWGGLEQRPTVVAFWRHDRFPKESRDFVQARLKPWGTCRRYGGLIELTVYGLITDPVVLTEQLTALRELAELLTRHRGQAR